MFFFLLQDVRGEPIDDRLKLSCLKIVLENQQKTFSVDTYFATKSYQSVQIQYQKRFNCCNFPSK